MAACFSRNAIIIYAMVVMTLLSLGQGQVVDRVVEEGCPEIEYAYPFQSTCQYPAKFGTPYHLVAPFSNALVAIGGLTTTSESDDYHPVRFTGNKSDEGAQYVLKAVSNSGNPNITIGTSFTIQNVATNRFLGYASTSPKYTSSLMEVEEGHLIGSEIGHFAFQVACDVPLPCPTTYGARCLSYYLKVVDRGTQVVPVQRDGVTYPVVKGTIFVGTKTLPFLIRRVKAQDDILIEERIST